MTLNECMMKNEFEYGRHENYHKYHIRNVTWIYIYFYRYMYFIRIYKCVYVCTSV